MLVYVLLIAVKFIATSFSSILTRMFILLANDHSDLLIFNYSEHYHHQYESSLPSVSMKYSVSIIYVFIYVFIYSYILMFL